MAGGGLGVKKLILALVVAVLALTLVPLAFAGAPGGGGSKRGHAKFNAVGNVTAVAPADITVDPAAVSVITIKVKSGSHIKGLRGKEVVFTMAADAKVWQLTKDGAVAKTLTDVTAGDRVKVRGTIAKADDGAKAYTITNLKYRDLTPDVTPTPEPSTPPAAQ
jgi:hypothetical protein